MDNSYNVDTLVTLRIPIDVEAKDKEEAQEKAFKVAYDSYHYGNAIYDVETFRLEKWNEETGWEIEKWNDELETWEFVEIV